MRAVILPANWKGDITFLEISPASGEYSVLKPFTFYKPLRIPRICPY